MSLAMAIFVVVVVILILSLLLGSSVRSGGCVVNSKPSGPEPEIPRGEPSE